MVLLHVKQSEDQQFLYECRGSESVDSVIRDIVTVQNLQLKIVHLKEEGDLLALYGPYKDLKRNEDVNSDGEEGEEKDSPQCTSAVKQRGPSYERDPSYRRTGEACDPELAKKLTRALAEAETCASKVQVLHKIPLTPAMLREAIDIVKDEVTICFPMGLPGNDPVHQELTGAYSGKKVLGQDTARMWWAGKEFKRGNKISDHVGKNEKTKVVVKLTPPEHGAPPREPTCRKDLRIGI